MQHNSKSHVINKFVYASGFILLLLVIAAGGLLVLRKYDEPRWNEYIATPIKEWHQKKLTQNLYKDNPACLVYINKCEISDNLLYINSITINQSEITDISAFKELPLKSLFLCNLNVANISRGFNSQVLHLAK